MKKPFNDVRLWLMSAATPILIGACDPPPDDTKHPKFVISVTVLVAMTFVALLPQLRRMAVGAKALVQDRAG